jgi:hypothetical protein
LLDPVSKSKPKKKKKGYINKFYVYCTIILEERDRQAGRQAGLGSQPCPKARAALWVPITP